MQSVNTLLSSQLFHSYLQGTQTQFCPDLIVEVTSVCDRSCNGCYAKNLLKTQSKSEIYAKWPQMFLQKDHFAAVLDGLPKAMTSLSFRGGEPTRHPHVHELIEMASLRTKARLYLETHGRWITTGPDAELILSLQKSQTVVKISFDSMHELTATELAQMTCVLESFGIAHVVAITEDDQDAFEDTRRKCDFVPDDKVIFQKKAKTLSELPQPPLGVLSCSGKLSQSLNARAAFKDRR